MKYLAHIDAAVAVLFEVLRQGGEVPPDVSKEDLEVDHPGGVGPPPSQQGGPARTAHRILRPQT